MAYVLRAAGRASRYKKDQEGQLTISITASEYRDAFNYLIYWDQKQRLDMKKLNKLVPRIVKVDLEN